jgi:hypothetical protein
MAVHPFSERLLGGCKKKKKKKKKIIRIQKKKKKKKKKSKGWWRVATSIDRASRQQAQHNTNTTYLLLHTLPRAIHNQLAVLVRRCLAHRRHFFSSFSSSFFFSKFNNIIAIYNEK